MVDVLYSGRLGASRLVVIDPGDWLHIFAKTVNRVMQSVASIMQG